MVNRVTVAVLAALLFPLSSPARAYEPPGEWKTDKDSLSLLAGKQVIFAYHFAPDGGYPYIHPLRLPGGPVMTAFSPADHPWHRGLWFSWKFLNGVNYWEFVKNRANQPDGKTTVVGPAVIEAIGPTVRVRLNLEYSKGGVVLAEQRELIASLPRADGSYTMDWTSTFTAKDKDVVFDRTPPEKASWGGYGGLGFRASPTMRDFKAIDNQGRVGKDQIHGRMAAWLDFSGKFGDKNDTSIPAGVTIFDHPSNPRHPTHWYLSDNAKLPYFGPALLFAQPMTLNVGKSFTIKYRILVHSGLGDRATLEKEYQAFADGFVFPAPDRPHD